LNCILFYFYSLSSKTRDTKQTNKQPSSTNQIQAHLNQRRSRRRRMSFSTLTNSPNNKKTKQKKEGQ